MLHIFNNYSYGWVGTEVGIIHQWKQFTTHTYHIFIYNKLLCLLLVLQQSFNLYCKQKGKIFHL